jgi:hypothetical protein
LNKFINLTFKSVLLTLICTSAYSASYLARTVSRANCVIPTSPFLSPLSGITFNESISWDPKFLNGHYAAVRSTQTWVRTSPWYSETLEGNFSGGNVLATTWRAWGGRVFPYNARTIAGTPSGWRFVSGTHYERLTQERFTRTSYTSAVDCNITRW